ncbi:hypothetical protein L6R52_12545 [Myxococcota bacterium]|nr:hypothetical protein [Myxococcota bacterium]
MASRTTKSARLLLTISLITASVALPAPARASLDIAELYLRKVKLGERTFFQDGGWARWRNNLDLFYETEWIPGAGAADPRFTTVADDGSAFATWSVGGLALLSRPRSDLQLTFFSMLTGTGRAAIDADTAQILTTSVVATLFVPFAPQAFWAEETDTISQQITGFQLRYRGWVEATYGLLTDERGGATLYRNFVETNLPAIFLASNLVTSPAADRIERLNLALRYDEAAWASKLELGFVVQNVRDNRKFLFAEIDQLMEMWSAGVRVNVEEGFAEGRLGIHMSTYPHGSAKRNGKFGFAYELQAYLSVLDLQKANLWSNALGTPDGELVYGATAELYLQFPGILLLAFVSAAAAADADTEEERQQGIANAMAIADLADEDDGVYSGLTLGVAYNDAETLREVPSAVDSAHFYIRLRLLY